MADKIKTFGSKASVFHGHALKTSGNLRKKDLMMTKRGRIVSRKQHTAGLKSIKRLFAMGFKPKKGTFKLFRKGDTTKTARKSTRKARGSRSRSTRRRGGFTDASGAMHALNGVMKAMVPK